MRKALMAFLFAGLLAAALLPAAASPGTATNTNNPPTNTTLLPPGLTQSAAVSWVPSTDTNIISYNLYYGVASGSYTNEISVGNVTNTTVSGLVNGTTYYFAATAVTALGVESAFSPETSYLVPAAAMLTSGTMTSIGFSFSVIGVSGYSYVMQASSNLVNWYSITTNTIGTNEAPFLFIDPNASLFSQRFYRAVYMP